MHCFATNEGFGLASHLGVLSGIPCVGVGKKLFHVDGLEMSPAYKDKVCTFVHTAPNACPCCQNQFSSQNYYCVGKSKLVPCVCLLCQLNQCSLRIMYLFPVPKFLLG